MTTPTLNNNKIPWTIFICVALGVYMATLDGSIVAVALPSIRSDFDAELKVIQWVLSIYMLVITSLLLGAGRVADILGQKKVYLLGLTVFTIGSALCSAAGSPSALIASRGVQGVGASMLMACAPAIITATFHPSQRGRGLGLLGTIVGLGLTTGPPLGGFLIDLFGWRAIFIINIPVGALAIGYGLKKLPALRFTKEGQKFDFSGMMLMAAFSSLLLLASSEIRETGGGNANIYFGATLLFFAAFIVRELKASDPLINLSLFRIRAFSAALAAALLTFVSGITFLLLMPFYLSEVMGLSPFEMGMTLMVTPFIMMVLAPWAGSISDKIGYGLLTTWGLALRAMAFAILILITPETPLSVSIIGLAFIGLGNAIFMPPNTSAVMGSVKPEMLGIAGGLTAVARNLGMALGVALGSALFDKAIYEAGAASIGEAAAKSPEIFMAGWRATMTMALVVSLIAIGFSRMRGADKIGSKG